MKTTGIFTQNNFEDNVFEKLNKTPWKVIIVVDVPLVHEVTKLALSDLKFENRNIEFISAYTQDDADKIITRDPENTLVLLDVVMEHNQRGEEIEQYISKKVNKKISCIVLRPDRVVDAVRHGVMTNYTLNNCEPEKKCELEKFYTVMYSTLRPYHDIISAKEDDNDSSNITKFSKDIFMLRS